VRTHAVQRENLLEQKVDQLTDILLKQMAINDQQKRINEAHQRSIEKLENILASLL